MRLTSLPILPLCCLSLDQLIGLLILDTVILTLSDKCFLYVPLVRFFIYGIFFSIEIFSFYLIKLSIFLYDFWVCYITRKVSLEFFFLLPMMKE